MEILDNKAIEHHFKPSYQIQNDNNQEEGLI